MKYLFWVLTPILVLVVFVVLKLCKVIAWSWWWVCAPLWIPLAIVVLLAIYVVYTLRNEGYDFRNDGHEEYD